MVNMVHIDFIIPNLFWSLGAIKTDVKASRIPHPMNTNPIPCASSPITKGA